METLGATAVVLLRTHYRVPDWEWQHFHPYLRTGLKGTSSPLIQMQTGGSQTSPILSTFIRKINFQLDVTHNIAQPC